MTQKPGPLLEFWGRGTMLRLSHSSEPTQQHSRSASPGGEAVLRAASRTGEGLGLPQSLPVGMCLLMCLRTGPSICTVETHTHTPHTAMHGAIHLSRRASCQK